MNNYSLNNKWYIPRRESFEQEGFSTYQVLKQVLIHIKDHFVQLPGGKIDLNAITMKVNHPDWTWLDIVNDLDDVAIFFEERFDEALDENIMFFDVKSFKDAPKNASSVMTEYIGLYSGILVKTCNGDAEYANDCIELCDESDNAGEYDLKSNCVYSSYHDGWIQDSEKKWVESNHEYFQEDNVPDTVHWSEWNDAYVDEDDDYVYHGIINHRGHSGWFYNDDYVYCEDNDTYYSDAECAEDNGVRWCSRRDEWTLGGNRDDVNAEYQSQERVFKFTPDTVFGIGFEIEKEDYDEVDEKWYPLYTATGWAKENDSSLDCESGYELVSPAFDLFSDRLDKDIEGSAVLRNLINANYGTSCGGHLTFSSSDYTANELLEGVAGFIPLLYALYNGRLDNSYCEPKQKWVYHRGSGRDAVNIRGNRIADNTNGKVFGAIEFRLFSAVRSVKNLLWRRDLMKIIANNINKSEKEVLRMLCNPNSLLFKHLVKVYSVDRIVDKIRMFVEFSRQYNFRKIDMPNLDAVKEKLKKSSNKNQNDSTNELGA